MNLFYRDLNIPPKINCTVELLNSRFPIDQYTYLHKIFDQENHIWLGEDFESWLSSFDLIVKRIEIFHTESNRITGWHTDMNPPIDWVKINWVFEKGISHMEWVDFDEIENLKLKKTIAGTSYLRLEDENINPVSRHRLVGPTLINAGKFHRIDNSKNTDRWCLSAIVWNQTENRRVSWDEAIKLFKEYLR